MKKLLNRFFTFPDFQEMEAKPRREHYLIERMDKLKKLAQCARNDKNDLKLRQTTRLIFLLNNRLSANSQLLMAHIERKQVKN